MGRSTLFSRLRASMKRASFLSAHPINTREGIEALDEIERRRRRGQSLSRRELVALFGAAGAATLAGCAEGVDVGRSASEARGGNGVGNASSADVAIVGAGLAGLSCAYELERRGVVATVYEARDRVGGRTFSMSGFSPGQVIERGGELIDTTHTTMRGYATEFGLTLDNITRTSGDVAYFFDGQPWPEATVVDEYRAFVEAMRGDLRSIGSPTARSHTAADRALDLTSLTDYLSSRGAGPLLRQVLDVAYNIEYGIEASEQSALAFLLFAHADRRSRFQPFGIFSDEKFHIREGNQRVALEIARRLARPIEHDCRLVRVARTAGGRIELTFRRGNRTITRAHDRVVLTLPFSVLRQVELDSSLALAPEKLRAIRELRYGTNAKTMFAFAARPWLALGSNGSSYSDLAHHQATWETSPTTATATSAVLTDYSGGLRGAALDPSRLAQQTANFLADLDRVYPGASASVRRDARGNAVAHLEHWPSDPLALGSYTANHVGYFTTIADIEAEASGNLHFAGEHTSSFYEWQGFMEGAALSGVRAAGEVFAAVR